ncbi:hypothetical protein [Salinisphaera sp. Q1T1-3]|uniref:hypothetical protein n=1 Tax=Salinisphaera sp. Q1T1-3 TaxID=2321229 RepID=UPI000E716249|nr:hypothetical protein [Salinisphaera sp. Q1T1-3]RJS94458.1 hypothetical protein D3260_05020 [Salinisphaera sp. Q1T1-3]
MGLFNLLSPVFGAIDGLFATVLPASLRLALWAAGLAVATMLLYKILSPQARIGEAKREAREARRTLNRFDGEFADAGPLIKNQFVTAFRHIGLVVPGTFIAILPLLCFLVWADNQFGHTLPAPGDPAPAVRTVPESGSDMQTTWQAANGADRPAQLDVRYGSQAQHYAMTAPVNIVAKSSAWNWLVGNPLGYLPADAPVEAVTIELPTREFIHFGPAWMRGWFSIFIPVMFIISLGMFRWAKIE